MADAAAGKPAPKTDVIDTIQSLVVAFVVAMTFRGFVLEGFMIPTGSMAPTLLGAHVSLHSPVTGYSYTADAGAVDPNATLPIVDPMLSPRLPVGAEPGRQLLSRAAAGDRVLVLKYIWPLLEPARWDVAVFKTPPDPVGESQNYIKRLVGLPLESILLADGDVFTGPPGSKADALTIARKPEYVQRAVWQPVYDSDDQPINLSRWEEKWRQPWPGPPLKGTGGGSWTIRDSRAWSCTAADPADLTWDPAVLAITDWNAYNVWRPVAIFPVSDIRMAGVLEAANAAAFKTSFHLRTRGHRFEILIGGGSATATVTEHETGHVVATQQAPFAFPASGRARIEFWHVDQALWLFVDDAVVLKLEYSLGTPEHRLELAGVSIERYRTDPVAAKPQGVSELRWHFEGSPVTLRRVRVDRDLYYQPGLHQQGNQSLVNGPAIHGRAFATDLDEPAVLGADQFLMLGDNSSASRDGRFWGRPHLLVVRDLGVETPFVVPRPLLVGKAWSVYFPATAPLASGVDGAGAEDRLPWLSLNFGRLRFIR